MASGGFEKIFCQQKKWQAKSKTEILNERPQELNETDIQTTNFDEVAESFDDMGLKPELLRGIFAYG